MHIESFREYCLSKRGVTEETPFGPDTLVYKVMGKMFSICSIDNFGDINLKCDPELAQELRDKYDFVIPGYHMNKKHWNTIQTNTGVPDDLLHKWIDHSYELVVNGLTKKLKEELNNIDI